MPALNVQFSDEEMAVLRAYAQRHQLSLKDAVRYAVKSADHTDRVAEATIRAGRISEGLSRRLADL